MNLTQIKIESEICFKKIICSKNMAKSYPKNILIIKSCIDTSLGTLLGEKYDSTEFMLALLLE